MGGLRSRLPVPFWSVLIGSAALAALPLTAGFASKDLILLRVWEVDGAGMWLWGLAALAAIITALYSFKLVFMVFFGPVQTEPSHQPGWRMALPLSLLCALSLLGGWIVLPLADVVPLPAAEPAVGLLPALGLLPAVPDQVGRGPERKLPEESALRQKLPPGRSFGS